MRLITAELASCHGRSPAAGAIKYRTDIQGMRALAVGAVVLSHAEIPGFAGGFVGVDVFFVISGFLISRLLFAELATTGTIDLFAFWIKRARRLLPNALLTLACTAFLAAFVFTGYNLDLLGRDIIWACIELSNFYFAARDVDYFRPDTMPSPVLHFWSLSVEEQFYFIWPILLLGLACFQRDSVKAAGRVLAALWICSLAASIILTPMDQPLAYFGTGTRFWQLATGALLALHWQAITALPSALRQALGLLGLAAIGVSLFSFTPAMDYPGAWGLLPSLGAAGLIVAGSAGGGPIQRLLSLNVLQWVGARSYSWYLWHWPLIVLPRGTYGNIAIIALLAIPASLVVASLAYRFVEEPVRRAKHLYMPSLRIAGATIGAIVAVLTVWNMDIALTEQGREIRDRRIVMQKAHDEVHGHEASGCLLNARETVQPGCLFGDTSARRRIVLFGDSHAAYWFNPLAAAAGQLGWRLNAWTKSSCPPSDIVSSRKQGSAPNHPCFAWRKEVMAQLTGPDRPDVVILSSRVDYTGRTMDPGTGRILAKSEADEAFRAGLDAVISRLVQAGIEVVVIRDIPRAFAHFEKCFIAGAPCDRPRSEAMAVSGVEVDVARSFDHGVMLADFTDAICEADACPTVRNGAIVYKDDNHLTAGFARTLTPQFVQLLQTLADSDSKRREWTVAQGADVGPSGSISPVR
jgi:peptidoglycan/LPS O-acetylase OafA/YrhL